MTFIYAKLQTPPTAANANVTGDAHPGVTVNEDELVLTLAKTAA